MQFEICATNLQSALAAQEAGAHRIELCAALETGGLTPSRGLIQAVVDALEIPVHVLIRPREGDFCYSEPELEIMLHDIRICKEIGTAGVVVGVLLENGELDLPKMQAMKTTAQSMDITCHRAFDFMPDPLEALEQLIDSGFGRVLTSGQAASAMEGRVLLRELVAQAQARIAVMPGGGISPVNIRALSEFTGATHFHFSGKKKQAGTLEKQLPGLDTWHWESDVSQLRNIMNALQT